MCVCVWTGLLTQSLACRPPDRFHVHGWHCCSYLEAAVSFFASFAIARAFGCDTSYPLYLVYNRTPLSGRLTS
ncbi:hypothetical protein PF005_g1301 [Phytophthora fragariae]|uniref:Uncharacterized protein n=1 Tax=Phytophthora fragariae TaxID=53985 RepID=A0A6A3ZFK2_9STRA|nr:hypothetical protein PF003_g4188 [Phytophthora fragariae]KAE8949109.1 hypothetical protein PF009_g1323 [Phytophthora fragariae]KAE9030038.1 hypothetical protein PF011_g795 [Phytophthora fragariae]KAE9138201.1 hypothetical protein PF010_g1031 [Phytophthora fragariae]KAE9138994.1 hypothetical protein PF007_g1191 [Phytophthora fragariae]